MVSSLSKNRSLIARMVMREVIGRYRGSVFGLAWSFFNPLLMLAVYTFVFGVVFKARWGTGEGTSRGDFALIIFVGMIVHGLFAECINRAPGLIHSNVNYVKKVVFPIEVLGWISLGSALFHLGISTLVMLAAELFFRGEVPWTAILFPLLLLPLCLVALGFVWFLASLGVFVRDIAQITGIFTTVLMFLSPMFYPTSALPEPYQVLLHINPLTYVIEASRDVLIWGKIPDLSALGLYYLVAMAVAWMGFWWFQKTRKGFSDVL